MPTRKTDKKAAAERKERGRDDAKVDAFVEHKVRGESDREAAKLAGYSQNDASAATQGKRLMADPEIRARVAERRAAFLAALRLDTDEIVGTLLSQMRGDFADILPDDEFLQEARRRGVSHLIRELKVTRRTIPAEVDEEGAVTTPVTLETKYEIRIHDSLAAAKELVSIFQLDKKPPTPPGAGAQAAAGGTPQQLKESAAALLEQGRRNLEQLA